MMVGFFTKSQLILHNGCYTLTGQLNINNLFDKKYYSGYSSYEYTYAEPVNEILSLKYKF